MGRTCLFLLCVALPAWGLDDDGERGADRGPWASGPEGHSEFGVSRGLEGFAPLDRCLFSNPPPPASPSTVSYRIPQPLTASASSRSVVLPPPPNIPLRDRLWGVPIMLDVQRERERSSFARVPFPLQVTQETFQRLAELRTASFGAAILSTLTWV